MILLKDNGEPSFPLTYVRANVRRRYVPYWVGVYRTDTAYAYRTESSLHSGKSAALLQEGKTVYSAAWKSISSTVHKENCSKCNRKDYCCLEKQQHCKEKLYSAAWKTCSTARKNWCSAARKNCSAAWKNCSTGNYLSISNSHWELFINQ